MVRTNYYYTELQLEQLKQLAEYTGLTTAELTRRAIDEYLSKKFERLQASQRLQANLTADKRLREELSEAEIQEVLEQCREIEERGVFYQVDIEELAEKARAKVAA